MKTALFYSSTCCRTETYGFDAFRQALFLSTKVSIFLPSLSRFSSCLSPLSFVDTVGCAVTFAQGNVRIIGQCLPAIAVTCYVLSVRLVNRLCLSAGFIPVLCDVKLAQFSVFAFLFYVKCAAW